MKQRAPLAVHLLLLFTGVLIAPNLCASVRALPSDIEGLYSHGRYREAVEALQEAMERTPEESSLYFWQGRCLFELRDYNRAIASLERAIALEPERSEYHYWLGKSYGRKAEDANPFSALSMAHKTHREFEIAVRLDANNIEAQRDLIRYLSTAPGIAGGSEEGAEQRIDALAAIDPTQARLARAGLFASHKKFNEAEEEYRKVLESNSKRIGIYFEIAEYYRDRGDAARMSEVTDLAASLAPSDPRLDYYRGIVLVLAGEAPSDGENHLRHYLETVPDNDDVPSHSTAHEWLGKVEEQEGQLDRALEEYHAALNSDPHNKQAREDLKLLQKKESGSKARF